MALTISSVNFLSSKLTHKNLGKSPPSIGMIELLIPCGGVPELLAPWEVTLMARFLTSGESLSHVDFSADPGWLELPAPLAGLPELLAPYQEKSTFGW